MSTVRTLLSVILATADEIVFNIYYERFLVLTVSRVAEKRQIRKSTKEILRSKFSSNNKTGQQKFTFNR